MERIHAPFCIGQIFIDAVGDPPCTVAGDDLDRGSLFFCKELEELLEHGLAVILPGLDYRVGIMIDNNGDVLMAFLIAGLIDADVDQPVKADVDIQFDIVMSPGDAAPNGLPIDTHVSGERTAA